MTGINKRKADPIIASSIDIQCEIQPVPFSAISTLQAGESSAVIRDMSSPHATCRKTATSPIRTSTATPK